MVWRLWGFGLDREQVQVLAELYNDTKCEPAFNHYDITRFVEDGEDIEVPGNRLWPLTKPDKGKVNLIPGLVSPVFGAMKF